jgi:hypothetical protein
MANPTARGKARKLVRDRQESVPNNRQKLCARRCELQGPWLALEEWLAAVTFQQPYLVADGCGCDGQLLSGFPEAQKASRGLEGLKLSKRRKAVHGSNSR